MFSNRKYNLFLLVLVHLLILAYPQAIKSVHVHHDEHRRHLDCGHTATIAESGKNCPVCDFEFVSFITETPPRATAFLEGVPLFNSPEPKISCNERLYYFSLRAPPVA